MPTTVIASLDGNSRGLLSQLRQAIMNMGSGTASKPLLEQIKSTYPYVQEYHYYNNVATNNLVAIDHKAMINGTLRIIREDIQYTDASVVGSPPIMRTMSVLV